MKQRDEWRSNIIIKAIHGTTYLKGDNQGIFAREEDVHVRDQFVIGNEHHSKNKEWSILENDVDQDAPNINGTTYLFGTLQLFGLLIFLSNPGFSSFSSGQDKRELKQTPRPNGKHHNTKDFIGIDFFILFIKKVQFSIFGVVSMREMYLEGIEKFNDIRSCSNINQ